MISGTNDQILCAYYLFIYFDIFTGSGMGNSGNAKVTLEKLITLVKGKNTIDLLSATVGLQVVPIQSQDIPLIFNFSIAEWVDKITLKNCGLY